MATDFYLDLVTQDPLPVVAAWVAKCCCLPNLTVLENGDLWLGSAVMDCHVRQNRWMRETIRMSYHIDAAVEISWRSAGPYRCYGDYHFQWMCMTAFVDLDCDALWRMDDLPIVLKKKGRVLLNCEEGGVKHYGPLFDSIGLAYTPCHLPWV